ncbi:phosphoribosylglycinamide formyltransferase [Breznakiellaceae bacterium SP9]
MNCIVLVSGNGTNLQALIDAQRSGVLGAVHIAAVISDTEGAYALERAKCAGIPAITETAVGAALSQRILAHALHFNAGFIILAGFLSFLEGALINEYAGRIINLHPSLLPKYGGVGMKGDAVHEAVLAAGETESGCTVHLVDAGIDTGRILLQRSVPVLQGDSAASLAARIHVEEHLAIVEAARMLGGVS